MIFIYVCFQLEVEVSLVRLAILRVSLLMDRRGLNIVEDTGCD
jgi:hypothetical protein